MTEMDGMENKSKFHANAILEVSLPVCKAGVVEKGMPLYRHIADLAGNPEVILLVPAFNMISGGSHAGNKLAMQEFMILPVGASCFLEAIFIGAEVYHNLKNIIKEKYRKDATNVGDEGGFAPNNLENKEVLELLKTAIAKASYTDQVVISMDMAASEFYRSGKDDLDFKSPDDPNRYITPDQLADLYKSFIQNDPVSTEDPFEQDDWDAWQKLTARAGIQMVGDDLTVTNPKWIAKSAGEESCNCLLLNVNQIGSVTESLQACKLAQSNGWVSWCPIDLGKVRTLSLPTWWWGSAPGRSRLVPLADLSAWPSTIRSLESRRSWAAKPSLLAGPSGTPWPSKAWAGDPGATSCLGPLSLMSSRRVKVVPVLVPPMSMFP